MDQPGPDPDRSGGREHHRASRGLRRYDEGADLQAERPVKLDDECPFRCARYQGGDPEGTGRAAGAGGLPRCAGYERVPAGSDGGPLLRR